LVATGPDDISSYTRFHIRYGYTSRTCPSSGTLLKIQAKRLPMASTLALKHVGSQLALVVLLVSIALVSGCSPPPALTAPEEALVRRCLELAHKQETSAECSQVTKPMQKSFLAKHPDFYDQLLSERKKFVEDRIAEDVRRRDELNECVADRASGNSNPPSCEKFRPHEIARALEDRRRTGCAQSTLDGKPDASQRCEGLSDRDIEDELQMERVRRERNR
jgi:hypothetical protein